MPSNGTWILFVRKKKVGERLLNSRKHTHTKAHEKNLAVKEQVFVRACQVINFLIVIACSFVAMMTRQTRSEVLRLINRNIQTLSP